MTKLLVLGGSGMIGSKFIEANSTKFEIISPTHDNLDLLDHQSVISYFEANQFDQILYAAGYTNVDKAEEEKELCFNLNSVIPQKIAEYAANNQIHFCYLSTDYVFSGNKNDSPYTEEDQKDPVTSVYAKSKAEGEEAVLAVNPKVLIVRLIMPFSANFDKKSDIVRTTISRLKEGKGMAGITDQKINPILVDDLISGISLLLENKSTGIYHLGAKDFTTPYEMFLKISEAFNLDKSLITKITFAEFSQGRPAQRPQNSWLDTSKFRGEFGEDILHTVDEEINLFKENNSI